MNKISLLMSDPSSVSPESFPVLMGPCHLTQAQAKAHQELVLLSALLNQKSEYGGFRPRANPLLCGPSGGGKSSVVKRLCDTLSEPGKPFPLLSVNTGSWIVYGAKAEPQTLDVIRSFVRQHQRGCLFMDELDKVTPSGKIWTDSWTMSVIAELLALLDADTRLKMAGWHAEDIDRLQHFFIIGAGAWQRHTDSDRKDAYVDAIRKESGIPPEILFRFNARLIEVSMPTRKDFQTAFLRIHADLKLPALKEADLDLLLNAAESSRAGMRFVEQYLSDLLCKYPDRLKRPEPVPENKEDKERVSKVQLQNEMQLFFRLLEDLEPQLALIRWQCHLHSERFAPVLVMDGKAPDMNRWYCHFKELQDALRYRYYDLKDRADGNKVLWESGYEVASSLKTLLTQEISFLERKRLLSDFAMAHAKLQRILQAMQYLDHLVVDDAAK